MRTPLSCVLLAACCLTLSACTGFNPRTEDLMRPPKLTAEQKALEDALAKSAISSHITFKYPKTGDYRSAFVFHDLDGDGEEEALVFYAAPDQSEDARMSLLDLRDGRWTAVKDVAGEDKDVEFVSFASVTGPQSRDVIVGWSNPGQEGKDLSVYSYVGGQLETRFGGAYESYLVEDLDDDGLQEVFLLSRDTGDPTLSLIKWDGYSLSRTGRALLSGDVAQFAGITAGRLTAGDTQKGLFVDELLSENRMTAELATELFTIENGTLYPVISYDMQSDEELREEAIAAADGSSDEIDAPDYQSRTLYELTRRTSVSYTPEDTPFPVCADVNGDGIIEIPTNRLLPGHEGLDEAEQLYLTYYNQLKGRRLVRMQAVAVNREKGYQVEFPAAWLGKVSIVNRLEDNEWRFVEFGQSLDQSKELARIRVVSKKDYQDKFLSDYQVFAERGLFTYYGYVPQESPDSLAATSPLAITLAELKQMFSLL